MEKRARLGWRLDRRLAGLLGALALSLGALGWWMSSAAGDAAIRAAEPGGAPGDRAPAVLTGSESSDALESIDRPRSEVALLAEAPEETARAASGGGLWMRVIDARTREPVPKAEVGWVDLWSLPSGLWAAEQLRTPDLEERVGKLGQKAVADERGELRIPRTERALVAIARSGSSFGSRTFGMDAEEPALLSIEPDVSITVRVVDAAGVPQAGVPVSLRTREGSSGENLWQGRTAGEHGTVEIKNARQLAGAREERLAIGLGFPQARPDEVEIDLASPPSAPVSLTLGATGSLEVRLSALGGLVTAGAASTAGAAAPASPGGGRVDLWLDTSESVGPEAQSWDQVRYGAPIEEGRALFPHVELGRRYRVRPRLEEHRTGTRIARGPVSPGEAALFDFPLDAPWPIAVAEVLDEGGAPVAEARLRYGLVLEPARGFVSTAEALVTDATGRFRLPVRWPYAPGSRRELWLAWERSPGALLGARVDLSFQPQPGETDLGQVRLAPESPVASGTVVDDAGQPVAGARVFGEEQRAQAEGRPQNWNNVGGLAATTDPGGRFSIHGRPPRGAFALSATKEGYGRSERVPCAVGDAGLTLVVERGGAMEGSVLLPPGMRRSSIGLSVYGLGARAGEDGERIDSLELDARDRFRAVGLLAGSYRLAVELEGETAPVTEIAPIEILPGETCRDPRLQAIDLSTLCKSLRIDVVDLDGRAVRGGFAAVLAPETGVDAWREQFGIQHGIARVVTARRAVDLEVWSPGFRPTRLLGVDADRRVVLEPGLSVAVALAGGGDDLQGAEVYAQVTAVEPGHDEQEGAERERAPWRAGFGGQWISAGRATRVAFVAPAAGTYWIQIWTLRNGAWSSASAADGSTAWRLPVRDLGGEQVFEVLVAPPPAPPAASGAGE